MGYVLLWIESLAVSLLLVAALAACLAQFGPGQSRWFARGFALLMVCVGALAVVRLVASMGIGMSAAFSWLWIALVVAFAFGGAWAVLRGPWLGAAAILIALAPLAIYVVLALLAAMLHFRHMASGALFPAMVMLTVAYGVGAVGVLVYGLRRQSEPSLVRAGTWPRGRLAVALLVAVALHLMTFWNLDLAARQQLATLRAEAGALALSVGPPRVPDRDNAAIVYQQAFEAMGCNKDPANGCQEFFASGWQWEKQWQDAWKEKWTTWQDSEKIGFDLHAPELRRFLKRQGGALSLLRQAAAKPGCTFERDYGHPSIYMPLPELNSLRTAARLLALDAVCRASDEDYRGAVEDVNAMFRTAEHVSTDPILVSQFVAMAIDGSAIDTLRHVLVSRQVPPEDLATIHLPDGPAYRAVLRRSLRMEGACQLATFQQFGEGQIGLFEITSGPGGYPRANPVFSALYRVFLLGDDIAAQARFAAQMDRAAGLPYAQAKEVVKQSDHELQFYPGGVLTKLLTPALGRVIEAAARAEARRGTARLGLALYAYRACNGRFPDKLDELAPDFIPAVPRDPFDGQTMRFKRTGPRAVVYSIGPDLTDNGGAPYDRKTNTGDSTFTVP
ncbi:MAG: hypothetical protein ABSG68_06350 [Thermoguttaceae bacterium]|jgi:hypothetical protein